MMLAFVIMQGQLGGTALSVCLEFGVYPNLMYWHHAVLQRSRRPRQSLQKKQYNGHLLDM
jgi:hypothetical protein